MSVSLQKGQKVNLTKESAGLNQILIGLGWDEVKQAKSFFASKPKPIDCDASALLLCDGKIIKNEDLVYYGNLKHKSESVQHMGDNLTGAGEGDDEQILVELKKVPTQYNKIVLVVTIYQPRERKQHFGLIQNAFIRIIDKNGNKELCKYSLSENYNGMTAMIFGEVYRENDEWKFNAIGQATDDSGLNELVKRYML